MMTHLLSGLIWLPVLGGGLVFASGKEDMGGADRARWIALAVSVLSLALCVPLWQGFDGSSAAMQLVEQMPWVPSLGLQYHLGVDGLSMALVALTCVTNLVVVLASWRLVKTKVAQYLATFLVMQGMVIGIFTALDAMLFYVFWEGVLIPMYLCIGVWGSENRAFAAVKFFLYTFFGSALMLIALIYLGLKAGSFEIADFYPLALSYREQMLCFIAFLLAFAVKVPMWPVHTWLPDAHTEAPAGGSVILAALMLKVGGYGFVRFSMPILPDASQAMSWFLIVLSLIAIVSIGLIALAQTDMKRLIAYSSVAHMGFVTLGFFAVYQIVAHTHQTQVAVLGVEGAMVQMISHAFGSGALFLAFGLLYERMHTRLIADFGGVANVMPYFAAFFVLFAMTNVGLPGTAGFVGEFMVLMSVFQANVWIAFAAAMTLIVAAGYTLWMVKRVFYGPVGNEVVAKLQDIDGLEKGLLWMLALAVFAVGLYPEFLTKTMHGAVTHLVDLSLRTKMMS